MKKSRKEIAGWVEIRQELPRHAPNFRVYALAKQELKVGEFDPDDWDYAYKLDDFEVEVDSIKEWRGKAPRIIEVIREVCPEWNRLYAIDVCTKEMDEEKVEYAIRGWLEDEGYEVIAKIVRLPRVRVRRIPIPMEAFKGILKKGGEKGS